MDYQRAKLPVKKKLPATQRDVLRIETTEKKSKRNEEMDVDRGGGAANPKEGMEDADSIHEDQRKASTNSNVSDEKEAEAELQRQDRAILIDGQSDSSLFSSLASASSESISFRSTPPRPGPERNRESHSSSQSDSEILVRISRDSNTSEPGDSGSSPSSGNSTSDGDKSTGKASFAPALSGSTIAPVADIKRKRDADDDFDCPTIRRRYKQLKTEHALCAAVRESLQRRLSFAAGEPSETAHGRRQIAALQRQVDELQSELRLVRIEMFEQKRKNAVVLLSLWVAGMIFGGWAGIGVGRELE